MPSSTYTAERPEIVATLREFLAAIERHAFGFDYPTGLRAIAQQHQLLPVMWDSGGCLGLRTNGDVVSFLWDEPNRLRAETDVRICNTAYLHARLKYPALDSLAPVRPPNAVTCSYCNGSGHCSEVPADLADHFVCYCGGLGWLPGS